MLPYLIEGRKTNSIWLISLKASHYLSLTKSFCAKVSWVVGKCISEKRRAASTVEIFSIRTKRSGTDSVGPFWKRPDQLYIFQWETNNADGFQKCQNILLAFLTILYFIYQVENKQKVLRVAVVYIDYSSHRHQYFLKQYRVNRIKFSNFKLR